jgi:hypothetical protein
MTFMNYAIAKDLAVRKIEEELFILNRKTSRIHSFNATGAVLWEMTQQGCPSDRMASALVERFDVQSATAEKDVSEFLAGLLEQGLIETI